MGDNFSDWEKLTNQVRRDISRRDLLKVLLGASTLAVLPQCSIVRTLQNDDRRDSRILVIGAGIAGLGAARQLHDEGFEVTVIEGRDRIGGRIWTDHSWKDTPLDFGASWVMGNEDNPLMDLIRRFGIVSVESKFDESTIIYTENGQVLSPQRRKKGKTNAKRLMAELDVIRGTLDHDVALGTGIHKAMEHLQFAGKVKRDVLHRLHSDIEQDYGTEAANLSLRYWDELDECAGEDALFPGGYGQVPDRLAGGLKIELGQIVQKVEYNAKGVRILTSKGTFTADRVIITLPLGVLQSGAVTFDPVLPKKKSEAINRLGMGVLDKLYLRFPRCFWPVEQDWLQYMGQEQSGWAEFLNLHRYIKKPILVAFNIGAFARRLERLTDQQVVGEAMGVLRTIFGTAIPKPEAWHFTRWASDPFARGAYSYVPVGASGKDRDAIAEPIGNRIFFAGEATSRQFYGTVHGAYLSGKRAAQQVMEEVLP